MVTSLTPFDDNVPASLRTTPDQVRVYTLSLTNSTESSQQLPRDVKVASLTANGAALKVNLSYYDGTTEAPGNVLDESATLVIPLKDGETWTSPQEKEYNKVWAEITSGSGSATLTIVPGNGQLNGLVAET